MVWVRLRICWRCWSWLWPDAQPPGAESLENSLSRHRQVPHLESRGGKEEGLNYRILAKLP